MLGNKKKENDKYKNVRDNWIRAQEEEKKKRLKNKKKIDRSYEDIKKQWDIAKEEEIKKKTQRKVSYSEKTYEDVKRDWNKLKEQEIIKRLKVMEVSEDKNGKINLRKNQKFVEHHRWNLVFQSLVFISCLGGSVDEIPLFFVIFYEIFKAPVRQVLDAIFNSYTRIEGICTEYRYHPIKTIREDEDTFIVTITYAGGRKKQRFPAGEYSDISVGSRISVIKGKISRRVIYVENISCNIKEYI